MTLQELEQVKKDLANGIIVSRSQWIKVLEQAIDNEQRLDIIADELDTVFAIDAWDEHGNDLHVDFDVIRMQLK